MKCTACGYQLTLIEVGGVKVDACVGGCGGLWFDNQEIKKFDEVHEHAGESLVDIEKDANRKVNFDEKRACPSCADTIMYRHFFSSKRSIEVDECQRCGGIWLDAGELRAIREQFPTEESRNEAAKAYFEDLFGGELSQVKQRNEEELKKSRGVANMFKWICPSNYISGKQDWGAF